MKFIRDIKSEDIQEIGRIFNITIDHFDAMNAFTIAKSVYYSCEKEIIMPQNLIEIFKSLGVLDKFREDIIRHLVFNTYMHQFIQQSEIITSNHKECKEIVNELEELENGGKYGNFRNISNYIKKLENKIGSSFLLKKTLRENKSFNAKNKLIEQFEIPNAISPFIFFNVINYDFYQDIKDSKVYSTNVILNKVEMFEDFLIKRGESISLINQYLFEREYNIQLNVKIQKITEDEVYMEKFKDKKEIYKVLSLLTLLPDILGRLNYIEPFLKAKEIFLIMDNEKEEISWSSEISNIILHLALFTIPIMEIIHFQYTKEYETNLSDFERNIFINNSSNEIDIETFLTLSKYNQIAHNKYYQEQMENIIFNINNDENPDIDELVSFIISTENLKDHIKKEVRRCTDKIMNLF